MIVSSGNGAALFGRIDLPPDSPLVKRFLKAIKDKWVRPDIEVDQKVANVSRICRFIGTDNCKGGAGRQSKIISAPGTLEIIPEEKLAAFVPEPQKQSEDTRIQQQVTSLTFGKTCADQVVSIHGLLQAKKINYTHSEDADKKGVRCHWFHFACVLRPGHTDAKNWICVHPTEGISGGCHHGKCHGKGFLDILAVIVPEIAAQAAETFDDSYRLARGFLRSRSPLVFWQGIPHGYRDGSYAKEDEASIRAEISLYAKKEFDLLGFEKTPNVTLGLIYNVQAAAAALNFDRAESPHWRTEQKRGASEYLAFKNGLLHVPSFLAGGERADTVDTGLLFTRPPALRLRSESARTVPLHGVLSK